MPCAPSRAEFAQLAASACFLPTPLQVRPASHDAGCAAASNRPLRARWLTAVMKAGLRELIHLLKYGGVRPAANVLGRMLAEAIATLEPEFPAGSMVLVPVPLHRAKLRQRGFNQAELIARAAIKISPMRDRLHLCAGVLERTRETASQIGLTSHQRRENLRGAFAVAQRELVKGREVLLVDDVYTTGATVSECARVLRRAGATKVWVATVARTLKISAQHVEIGPHADYRTDDQRTDVGAQRVPLAKAVGI